MSAQRTGIESPWIELPEARTGSRSFGRSATSLWRRRRKALYSRRE
jgi:hypothetical protein